MSNTIHRTDVLRDDPGGGQVADDPGDGLRGDDPHELPGPGEERSVWGEETPGSGWSAEIRDRERPKCSGMRYVK